MRFEKLSIGAERAPLLIIDQAVADAEALVEDAAAKRFGPLISLFPGIRATAPASYQSLLAEALRGLLCETFDLDARGFRFALCHYSLVTTPPERLAPVQRRPHVDSVSPRELAAIHYLFKADHGGTAFYRHRATGFETIDQARTDAYLKALQIEVPAPGYINGGNDHYEPIASPAGVFNRMLVYRRNSLHSGSISPQFKLDPNPRTGRLSINSFLDVLA